MTITIMAGVDFLVLVMADCIHRFGAVGDLFSSLLDGKVFTAVSVSSLEGVLKDLAISLSRSFPSWQQACTIC